MVTRDGARSTRCAIATCRLGAVFAARGFGAFVPTWAAFVPFRLRGTLGAPRGPLAGTTLVREWRGEQIRVEVHENGFEWRGTMFRSLSGVARAITGTTWNGRLFFGLTKRTVAR